MDAIDAVTDALPAWGKAIRHRFWRDPEFRALCTDFRDATEAADRFAPSDKARSQEYREVAGELLAEVVKLLAGTSS